MDTNVQVNRVIGIEEQYSIGGILGIWALAAVPMGVLSWVIYPRLAPDFGSDPLSAGVTRMALITLGLVWQFALTLIIVWREEGDLRLATIKRRLRLNPPRDAKSGRPRRVLWLWLIPFIAAAAAWDIALTSPVEAAWLSVFPALSEPPGYGFDAVFASAVMLERLQGAWWFFGLFVASAVFNSFLGEEVLFRGVLLPKMEGVFGRWSWVANGCLFGLYHIHQPWGIAANVVSGALFLALPAWRFRSTWLSIIIHSVQSLYFAFLVLGVVLGLA